MQNCKINNDRNVIVNNFFPEAGFGASLGLAQKFSESPTSVVSAMNFIVEGKLVADEVVTSLKNREVRPSNNAFRPISPEASSEDETPVAQMVAFASFDIFFDKLLDYGSSFNAEYRISVSDEDLPAELHWVCKRAKHYQELLVHAKRLSRTRQEESVSIMDELLKIVEEKASLVVLKWYNAYKPTIDMYKASGDEAKDSRLAMFCKQVHVVDFLFLYDFLGDGAPLDSHLIDALDIRV